MSSFTFNTSIPASGNNPSNDQPIMLTNNVSTNAIINVDHVTFNTLGGGQHKQITFNNKNVPGAQTDPQSTLFTNSGTASTVADLFFTNQNGTFQSSPIKAWAFCDNNGNIQGNQSLNIASVVHNSTGVFTVTLTSNAVTGTNFGIISTCSQFGSPTKPAIATFTITGAAQFHLNFFSTNTTPTFVDPFFFSFLVMQI